MASDLPDLPPPPASLDGGRYRLESFLGEGGSGVVYRARSPEGWCAVKLKPIPERPIQAARFLVESVPMAAIDHPRVVRVLGTGREQGWYWIAMPYFPDGTLRDHVRRHGPLTVAGGLLLLEQILDGLQAVHEAGFVHRDIKPQNIFLDADGGAVIGDFGVARHLKGGLWFRTRTGQAIGTMGYRAPEQDTSAKDAGPEADLYGAAATLYFMLTGRRPPLLYASEAEPSLLDPLPEAVRPLVRRATAYRPEERYPTAESMRRDVQRLRLASRGSGATGTRRILESPIG